MIERERSNVPLAEEFTEHEWMYYDSYEAETKEQLAFQRHVDVRTFVPTSGEDWTKGTFGYLAAVEEFPAIVIDAEGIIESESATPSHPVDILTGFSDGDYFTFALPKFPLPSINTVQSKIEITSDPEGHCSNSKLTAVVSLSESLKPIIEGDSQFLIERSTLEQNEIDLSAITGVRIKIVYESGKTGAVYVMGVKLILAPAAGEPGWVVSTVDFDNWNGTLRKASPLNGDVTDGPLLDQGILWKADLFPGYNDPKPVNAEFGIVINPGSQTGHNEVVLYLRQEPLIFQTQLDLIGVTQSELDSWLYKQTGKQQQPDIGTEEYMPRTVGEFDKQPMSRFDHLETMEDLERLPVPNPVEESWITFTLKWGEGKTKAVLTNSVLPGYIFPKVPEMDNNTEYLIICSLENSSARMRIFALNKDKSVAQEPLWDSTLIEDDGVFRRRQGRIGWKAVIEDNDAYVHSIRPRSVVFAEYKSTPLTSFTPVDGAQLFANFTGNEELWNQGFEITPTESKGVILTRDKSRTLSGESFRVDTNGTEKNVGITTDLIEFIDFTQAEIRFFIWFAGEPRTVETIEDKHQASFPGPHKFPPFFPSKGYVTFDQEMLGNITAQLVSEEGTIIPLPMPELETNQWQEVVMRLPTSEIVQTGKYRVQILQPTLTASSWWVDDISIFERSVQWSARSVVSDAWNGNYAPWTDFREIVNVNRKGILLSPRGKDLQLRGRALRQNATIKTPKIIPRYANLGRLVWPEERLVGKEPPIAAFSTKAQSVKTYKFTDESTKGTAAIISREWSFGDGSFAAGNQLTAEHTYSLEGAYYATLITVDRNGLRSQATHIVEIF
jgi:PKD domain